ncbi:hypothetical protein F0562_009299 [Nyssa sinensis]|uniref:Uncharacterized protein n=1 Tax=Nyssa sinensis TaxID=561372 RepID=A0A5J4ZYG5_9ASTE|nr:hypothetical protein F0562_009299 [Nyssa sinensis]
MKNYLDSQIQAFFLWAPKSHRFAPLESPGLFYLKWESLRQRRDKIQGCLTPLKMAKIVQTVAATVAPSPADTAEHRKQL